MTKKQYISILRTNMSSLQVKIKKIDETRNYLFEEINYNDLMYEKYKKKYLNYVQRLLTLVSTVIG